VKKRIIFILIILLLGIISLGRVITQPSNPLLRVGMIVPVEHQALSDIVGGFEQEIRNIFGDEIILSVQNAQGDLNIQKGIIDKFKREEADIIVTIGTDSSAMVLSTIKKQPVICLDVATNFQYEQANATGTLEANVEPSIDFLRKAIPHLKKLTLVYSNTEKSYRDAQTTIDIAKKNNLEIQTLMVQSLPDLYSISRFIDPDTDAIFVAKDHFVASGIASLVKVSRELSLPLFTSDEGTVINGATFSLGNREADIGKAGAKIVRKLLTEKQSIVDIPMEELEEKTIFLNAEAAVMQMALFANIQEAALSLGYNVQLVNTEKQAGV